MKTKKIETYSQKRIAEKGNKGWLFTFSILLNETTNTTEQTQEVWIDDKEEALSDFLKNYSL